MSVYTQHRNVCPYKTQAKCSKNEVYAQPTPDGVYGYAWPRIYAPEYYYLNKNIMLPERTALETRGKLNRITDTAETLASETFVTVKPHMLYHTT